MPGPSVVFSPYPALRARAKEAEYGAIAGAVTDTSRILAQSLLAYHVEKDRELHRKFDSLVALGHTFGWEKLGQPGLDALAATTDAMAGSKIYPRDSGGKAMQPPRSMQEHLDDFLAKMSPDEQNTFYREHLGLGKTQRDQERLNIESRKEQDYAKHLTITESIEQKRLAIEEAKSKRGSEQDLPSGRVWDAKLGGGQGDFRDARQGEMSLTYRQIKERGAEGTFKIGQKRVVQMDANIAYLGKRLRDDPNMLRIMMNGDKLMTSPGGKKLLGRTLQKWAAGEHISLDPKDFEKPGFLERITNAVLGSYADDQDNVQTQPPGPGPGNVPQPQGDEATKQFYLDYGLTPP